MNDDPQELYGFNVGEIVETLIMDADENGAVIKKGSRLRLVCFVPKVRIYTPVASEQPHVDTKPYFFNAVRETQWDSDYGNRIRANFCTIKKCEQPRYRANDDEVWDGNRKICLTNFTDMTVSERNARAKLIAAALNQYTGRRDL